MIKGNIGRYPELPKELNAQLGALIKGKQFERAIRLVDLCLQHDEGNVFFLGRKVQALLGLHRHEEALQVAEARVKLQPADVIGLGLQTQALLGLHRHEEALQVAEAMVKLQPSDVVGQILRAQILFRGGQTGAAAEVVYGSLIRDGSVNFPLAVLAAKLAARGIYEERYDALFSLPDSFLPLTPSQAGSLIKHRIAREEDPSVTDPFGDTIFDASRTYLFQPIDKLARSIL